jgi:heme A synthase
VDAFGSGLVIRGGLTMNWNKWIRQIHRWLAIAFTVAVIVTFVALAQEKPVVWVSYVPLLPLALLLFTGLYTGLYLFALPYATKWRSASRTDRAEELP